MKLEEFLITPSEAVRRRGAEDHIVLSSRVRLARNLAEIPFPNRAKKAQRMEAMEQILAAAARLPEMKDGLLQTMDQFSQLEKLLLIERHLISREHAAKSSGSALALSRDQVYSIMINEEDHIRMQSLLPGLQLEQCWKAIDRVDSQLEQWLDYAFSPQLGYLTACPTNVGTAIRVSAMVHLPGLVLTDQVGRIINAINKLGLAVRGLYGEGTEALGNIFQVSNQVTLGDSEEEIISRVYKVVAQLIEYEQNARQNLLKKKRRSLLNTIGRAFGTLANAFTISSKETITLLSFFRLGIELGMFPNVERAVADELLLICQPGHLQAMYPEELKPEERDALRADLLRQRLRQIPGPVDPPTQLDKAGEM